MDNVGVPNIFQPLVASGFAFGATRWVNTIARHYERFAALTARSTPADSGGKKPIYTTLFLAVNEAPCMCPCF